MYALCMKCPVLYNNIENVILHQDDALSCTAARTQFEIHVLGLQKAALPPYSRDFAPLDFAYFPQWKLHLRYKHFGDREELMYVIQQFKWSLDSGWFGDVSEVSETTLQVYHTQRRLFQKGK